MRGRSPGTGSTDGNLLALIPVNPSRVKAMTPMQQAGKARPSVTIGRLRPRTPATDVEQESNMLFDVARLYVFEAMDALARARLGKEICDADEFLLRLGRVHPTENLAAQSSAYVSSNYSVGGAE